MLRLVSGRCRTGRPGAGLGRTRRTAYGNSKAQGGSHGCKTDRRGPQNRAFERSRSSPAFEGDRDPVGDRTMDQTTNMNADDFEPARKLAQDAEGVRRSFKAKFKRFAAKLPFAEDLLAAYYCAFDRQTPRHVQLSLLGALAYFVLPFDVIPDMMPVIGFADDAAVLATALRLVASHMRPEHREAAKRALARL